MRSTAVPERLRHALHRLVSAIDHIEAAASRRIEADAARANLDDELAVMADDRARLAADLDDALAHGRHLARANAEAGMRLDRAGAAVRGILDDVIRAEAAQGAAPPGAASGDPMAT